MFVAKLDKIKEEIAAKREKIAAEKERLENLAMQINKSASDVFAPIHETIYELNKTINAETDWKLHIERCAVTTPTDGCGYLLTISTGKSSYKTKVEYLYYTDHKRCLLINGSLYSSPEKFWSKIDSEILHHMGIVTDTITERSRAALTPG